MRSINPECMVTEWDAPTSMLDSEYGVVTYFDWCCYELRRINQGKVRAVIVESPSGNICIATKVPAGCSVHPSCSTQSMEMYA